RAGTRAPPRLLPRASRGQQLSPPGCAGRLELPCPAHRSRGGRGVKNWEVFLEDPRKRTLPNDGVAKVGRPTKKEEWDVLRYELETFVCSGEYERGLEQILASFLANVSQPTQPAVWASGFYGSGKSHLVKVRSEEH